MVSQRGRKPKPTAIKLLEGNPGHRPIDEEREPKPRSVRHESAPPHLNDEAKREWRRMIRRLAPLGLYSELDRPALVLYCVAWSQHVKAETELQKNGLIVTSPNGYPMVSPYASIANRAWSQVMRSLAEFGMSPSSRTRIKADPKEDPSGEGWGDFLDD